MKKCENFIKFYIPIDLFQWAELHGIGLLTFAFYWLSGSDFHVFGKSMYFLLNIVSEALKWNIIH